MCAKAVKIMRFADQEWMDLTNHPNRTCVLMYCTLSKASFALGR